MKRYPKIVQIDSRGQIVIPKDIRQELDIDEGTGFWMYVVTEEGILLKKAEAKPLEEHGEIVAELEEKGEKIGLKRKNVEKSRQRYKKTKKGRFELI
jgi:AbrB family looped-hinge helix DNA binding protein